MRNWEYLVIAVHVFARDNFYGKIVGNATMARKNVEVYRFMITFFICKDNVFRISQIFCSYL